MLSFLLLALGLISQAFAGSLIPRESSSTSAAICGTAIDEDTLKSAERDFAANLNSTLASREPSANTVPVYFHVVSEGSSAEQGNLPDSQIQAQMAYLNQFFRPISLSFQLSGIDRHTNPTWFNKANLDTPAVQAQMKNQLRRGDVKALNVYTVGLTETNSLGYSTFPKDYNSNPKDDGVVLRFSTLPGGSSAPFNMGGILVHEVGHWVGLYHTFQDGCTYPGDYVEDTPTQASASSGCPNGRDSCSQPGLDPIHNPMDYSDDACATGFTNGQFTRMRQQLQYYRGINL